MKRTGWVAAACLVLAGASGCESAEGTGGDAGFELGGPETVGDAVEAEVTADAAAPDEGPDVGDDVTTPVTGGPLPDGKYASLRRFTSVTQPPIGGPGEAVTETLVLHELRTEAGVRLTTQRTCAVTQNEQSGVRPVFGPEFIAALPVTEVVVTVDGPEKGPWTVDFAPDLMVLGATLADPEADALPTTPDDPRVVDADADGQPGLTVKLTGLISGEVWMTQRLRGGMSGTLTADGRLEGLLLGSSEQTTLGADPAVLKDFATTAEKHPDPAKSTFVWVPVPAAMDCATLKAQAETLFE